MIGDIMQPTHLLFVLAIALLVLGPKRLPEVGRQLGKGLRDFRAAINGDSPQHDEPADEPVPLSEVHQTSPQPVEHEFSHQTTATVASEPTSGSSAESAGEAHQLGSDGTESSGTAGEHEFAYEPARSAETPSDSLS